jgi:hypothetical protein
MKILISVFFILVCFVNVGISGTCVASGNGEVTCAYDAPVKTPLFDSDFNKMEKPIGNERTCEECPYGAGCTFSMKDSNDCNTCTCNTWCENGQWKTTNSCYCTLAYCPKIYDIPNPYRRF